MPASNAQPARHRTSPPSVDDLFAETPPLRSVDELARDGLFDDEELQEFLADHSASRRAEPA
jgi:hypothetical protein